MIVISGYFQVILTKKKKTDYTDNCDGFGHFSCDMKLSYSYEISILNPYAVYPTNMKQTNKNNIKLKEMKMKWKNENVLTQVVDRHKPNRHKHTKAKQWTIKII